MKKCPFQIWPGYTQRTIISHKKSRRDAHTNFDVVPPIRPSCPGFFAHRVEPCFMIQPSNPPIARTFLNFLTLRRFELSLVLNRKSILRRIDHNIPMPSSVHPLISGALTIDESRNASAILPRFLAPLCFPPKRDEHELV